jgi:hypothetical protein
MKPTPTMKALLVGMSIGLLAVSAGAQLATREVFGRPTVPIRALPQPGDQRIIIDSGPPPLRAFIPSYIPAAELLSGNAEIAHTVAVVRIESRQPRLTSDGRWIVTQVRAHVVESYKPRTLKESHYIEFQQDGGSLEIDGVLIQCEAGWETDYAIGKQYLLFIAGSAPGVVQWSYRISEGRTLESLFPGFIEDGEVDTGHGLALSKARRYLRQVR